MTYYATRRTVSRETLQLISMVLGVGLAVAILTFILYIF